jgi:hypothetical protein
MVEINDKLETRMKNETMEGMRKEEKLFLEKFALIEEIKNWEIEKENLIQKKNLEEILNDKKLFKKNNTNKIFNVFEEDEEDDNEEENLNSFLL